MSEQHWALQHADYRRHVAESHARGECPDSGLPMKQCILGVCDCGLEFTPDDMLDEVVERALKGEFDE